MGSAHDDPGRRLGVQDQGQRRDGAMAARAVLVGVLPASGEKVAVAHENGQRVAVIAVPPVRCFAAAAAAASAVVAVAREAEAVPDVEKHFSVLAQLPVGTALVVKMGAKIYAATFAGVIERGGEPVIHVEYKGMTHFIPKQQCQRVQVGSGGGKKTLPARSPRSIQTDFRSIAAIVGREVAAQFVESLPLMSCWWDM